MSQKTVVEPNDITGARSRRSPPSLDRPTRSSRRPRRQSYSCHAERTLCIDASGEGNEEREVHEPAGGGRAGPASSGGGRRDVARDGEGPHLAAWRRRAREGERGEGKRRRQQKRQQPQDAKKTLL